MANKDDTTFEELIECLKQTGYEMSEGNKYPNNLIRERLKFVIGPLVISLTKTVLLRKSFQVEESRIILP